MKESLDNNIKIILFDLDGTLLDINLDLFVSQYTKLWAQSVAHLISFNKFIAKVLKASKAVEENTGENSNADVYFNAFFPIEGYTHEDLEPFFNNFYETDVSKLHQFAQRKPEARKAIQTAFDKGYDVTIATTLLLPAFVIEQRL